jgi:hypothetical protein
MLPYIAAKTVTDINDGFNVCSVPQEQISRVFTSFLSFSGNSNPTSVYRIAVRLHF